MTLCFEGQTVINESERKKVRDRESDFRRGPKKFGIERVTVAGDQHFSSRWRKKV